MGRCCLLLVLLLSFSVSAAMENTRKVPCRALAAMKDEKSQWCTACQRHPKPKKACTRSTATAPAVSSLSEGRSILPGKRKASGANYTGEVIDHTYPPNYHFSRAKPEDQFAPSVHAATGSSKRAAVPSVLASLASGATAINTSDSPEQRASKLASRQNLIIAELQAENRELKESVSGMQSKLVDLHEATRVLRVTAANIARAANEQADAVNYFEHVQEHEFHDDTIDMAKQTRSDIVNALLCPCSHRGPPPLLSHTRCAGAV
jgi:hypothetical protein